MLSAPSWIENKSCYSYINDILLQFIWMYFLKAKRLINLPFIIVSIIMFGDVPRVLLTPSVYCDQKPWRFILRLQGGR